MKKRVALLVRMDKDLRRAAKIKAAQTGIPMGVFCLRALKAWVAEDKPVIAPDEKQTTPNTQ